MVGAFQACRPGGVVRGERAIVIFKDNANMTVPDSHNPARVLVFPCGTEIGLEIHRALTPSPHVTLIGASSTASNHGPYVFRHYVEDIPYVQDPACIGRLAGLIEQHKVDLIYPAHDDAVAVLSRHVSDLGCDLIAAPAETCALCRKKSATYARLGRRLAVPRIYARTQAAPPYPLFLKPDAGQGSRGTCIAHSEQAWDVALEQDPTLIALDYLPGPEYTVDCFSDRHGALRFVGPRERLRTINGISAHTRPVPPDEFLPLARCIHETLVLRGAWFFQVKRDRAGRLTLLEVAPRVSGGMGLYRNLGVNLPLLSVYDRLGLDVEIMPLTHAVEMDRALVARFRLGLEYGHVYLDLDDTLLCRGKVNPLLAAFIFQCRNAGKQLHLLTRHADDPNQTLAQHGLAGCFHTVTHLNREADKADHILHDDALFIDDSHAERRRVHKARGIPVFAPDAVESLLDWRA